jgi:hypothetical protein
MSISVHPGVEEWDSPQFYHIPEETMIDIASDYLEDLEHHGDIGNFFEFQSLEAPYHGWQGYDNEAAVDDAIEQLHEAGVLNR